MSHLGAVGRVAGDDQAAASSACPRSSSRWSPRACRRPALTVIVAVHHAAAQAGVVARSVDACTSKLPVPKKFGAGVNFRPALRLGERDEVAVR